MPDQSKVPEVGWKAVARATYDQAVAIMESPPSMGTMRDLFDHRLTTYGQAYEVQGLVEAYTEIEQLRGALAGVVDLYRHPDSGRLILEAGSSGADDALIVAAKALGEDVI